MRVLFAPLRVTGCVVLIGCATAGAQVPPAIQAMARNEVAARKVAGHFAYISDERSDRTGGHLWREQVVEVGDGVLRRLLAVDGRALSKTEADADMERLRAMANNPDEFRRINQAHKDDEVHATALLELLPRAYFITPDGKEGECTRFRFAPNDTFRPSTYEERVGAAMAGTISIKEPEDRLCSLQGTLQRPVLFGFGLIGKLASGGSVRLQRVPLSGGQWKSQSISAHVDGKILLMKSLSKQQDSVRTDIRPVPMNLTLEQGIALIAP